MKHGDLFSGIGGFALAARRLGWRTAWFSEIDPYASKVLARHWPDVPNHGDVRTIDYQLVEPVDIITGGFPCQPHSLAGKKKGSDDERDLWPECVRALRDLRPLGAQFENVPGLFLSDGGRFFNRILSDLAALGYDAEWQMLSAADVGAPHLRQRVWLTCWRREFVADANGHEYKGGASPNGWAPAAELPTHSQSDGRGQGITDGGGEAVADAEVDQERTGHCTSEPAGQRRGRSGDGDRTRADAISERLEGEQQGRPAAGAADRPGDGCDPGWWAIEPDFRGMVDGLSKGLDNASQGMGSEEGEEGRSGCDLRDLRWLIAAWLASQGRRSHEQRSVELSNALRQLSHGGALANRQRSVANPSGYLHGLRQACEAIGAVRDTPFETTEAWLALSQEDQSWAIVAACRGPWHSEWPGVPRVSNGVPARVDRLKGLGNAIVPAVAIPALRRLATRIAEAQAQGLTK